MPKLSSYILAGVATLSLAATGAAADPLADGFRAPPNSARPRVWWHWMNGNVTIDGIEKDLAWMARVGIGGVQNFDASLATPQIVAKRLVYMDPDWKAAFRRAVEVADQKGLEFAIAASPGWSETGGPWVKPEDGMKKLVWSETLVPGGKRFTGKLSAPPKTTGPYQAAALWDPIAAFTGSAVVTPPEMSGPVGVFAVSTGASVLPAPSFALGDGTALTAPEMTDGNPETAIPVKLGKPDPTMLVLDYGKPVTVRSGKLYLLHAKPPFGDPATSPVLEVESGGGWTKIADLPVSEAGSTAGFAPVTAQRFRVVFAPYSGKPRPGLGEGAPGAVTFDISALSRATAVQIGEVALSGDARVDQAEVKAGYGTVPDYHAIAARGTTAATTRAIDLSGRVKPDGTLDWTPPKGSAWRVYRFGWSLTGKSNHPATKEATGLEVDKYDSVAVRRYMDTYLGMYRDTVGKDMIGKRGIRALLTDSIEVGASNWTMGLPAEFRARRGYDIGPWMPALAGEVIGSEADTDKFLFDFRRTLADMLADNHYGTVAKVAHENGMIVYGEALEDVRPLLGDDLAMRKHADVPMAALWTWNRGSSPRPTLVGDMKGAASVAHVYGQNLVAAESMTAAGSPWAFAPRDLKRMIDLEFANGINRPVIHTSVHQPVDDKKPGLSLMIFGQYFNRHEAWAEMAKPWVDYLSRTSYLLQQGRNVADVAFFIGEEAPVTALTAYGPMPGLPKRYAVDYVNADMLRDALTVEGSEIVSKGGARYKALYLGGSSRQMTLPVLQRLAKMVEAGATLIGTKPQGSPSLRDDPVAFAALADRLWANPGVIATDDAEAGLARAKVAPAFGYRAANADADVLFVERRLDNASVFWINNRKDRAERVTATFRVADRIPELWDAITGQSRALDYIVRDGATEVVLDLGPEDAKFVVFRGSVSTTTGGTIVRLPKNMVMPAAKPVLFPGGPMPLKLASPWTVVFEPGRGAPAQTTMASLSPLDRNADAGIRYFSGTATYTAQFMLPDGVKPGESLALDLGQVGDIAEVRVNGQSAGAVWFAPFRVDIGKQVKRGANALEVRVATTWVNRLIGDAQPGATKVSFTAAPTYKPDAPLRPSGLIGPVSLVR
jgi:hypothetical protein